MCQIRVSKFSWASEGPQNGGKTTGMDIPEFRDINGLAPTPKNGAIGQIVTWGVDPPPPVSLGLRGCRYSLFILSSYTQLISLFPNVLPSSI